MRVEHVEIPSPPKSPWPSLADAIAESERASLLAVDRYELRVCGDNASETVRPRKAGR
jgi:hypothetical protein